MNMGCASASGGDGGAGWRPGLGEADDPEYSTRYRRIVVDSRTRNRGSYPTPAHYEVAFDEDIFNVRSVRLIVADVPFSAYLVGAGVAGGVPLEFPLAPGSPPSDWASVVAQLPQGDYASPEDMTSALASALQAAASTAAGLGAPTFAVAYLPRTDSFAVQCSAPFSLPFGAAADAFAGVANGGQRPRPAPSPARLLGFGPRQDYASSPLSALPSGAVATGTFPGAAETVLAPFRRDFRSDRYVVLKISPNAEVVHSVSQAIDRTFAVLPRGPSTDLNVNSVNDMFEKRWSPPLARVARMVLTFTDAYGLPYDFQNQDHRIEFLFECVGHRI